MLNGCIDTKSKSCLDLNTNPPEGVVVEEANNLKS